MRVSIQFTILLVVAIPRHLVALFFDPPIIDPDDPLENDGPYQIEKQPTDVILDTDALTGELFVPVKQAPFGFVLFMPGFGTSFKAYDDYMTHLASHGYLTMGLDFNSAAFSAESEHDLKAEQALDAIAFVQAMNDTYASLPVIAAGHSQGGKIAFYAASIDSENTISAVMALDPVNSGGPPCFIFPGVCRKYPVAPNVQSGQRGIMYQMNDVSSLIFRSRPDFFTNPEEQFNAQYFYYGSDGQGLDASPSPSWYYDLGAFGHGSYVPLLVSEEVQVVKRTMVAFLQDKIEGVNRTEYLTGEIIQSDLESGYLVSVETR